MPVKKDLNVNSGCQIQSPSPLYVTSLARGMFILEYFRDGTYLLGITEIARITGFEKNLVQRLTNTLHQTGYLGKDTVQRKYYLTPKILQHCYNYLRTRKLFALAMPALIDLRDSLDKSVNLCVLNDTQLIYVIRLWTRYYHEYSLFGENIPAYCSAGGRMLLSKLSEEEAIDVIERSQCSKITRSTITDKKEICSIVAGVREEGYCWQVSEFIENEIGVAVSVMDSTGTSATIIVSGLLKKVNPESCQEFIDDVLPQLQSTARSVSRLAGM